MPFDFNLPKLNEEVSYVQLQYQVKVAEYPGLMKGQLEIVVGTTKEAPEVLMTRRMSLLNVSEPFTPLGPRSRSGSIASRMSDSSVTTTLSVPPAYSQLSSRAMSLVSLDTRKWLTTMEKGFLRD